MSVECKDVEVITQLLGREPRGLEAVAKRDVTGVPMVIRVAPLVSNKPFPTLLWLIDKRLNYAIDTVEASGLIAEFQRRVDASEMLQEQMVDDHKAYIDLRQSYISSEQADIIASLGFTGVLADRGIGGIADFQRIRCLHTYYAAHLVRPNVVGRMLDQYWCEKEVGFTHYTFQK